MAAGRHGSVIGNFARLMRGPPRIVQPEEIADDAPPERFTQKISDEGGDVYVAPMLEALRAALARARGSLAGAREPAPVDGHADADASTAAPQEGTGAERTEARP